MTPPDGIDVERLEARAREMEAARLALRADGVQAYILAKRALYDLLSPAAVLALVARLRQAEAEREEAMNRVRVIAEQSDAMCAQGVFYARTLIRGTGDVDGLTDADADAWAVYRYARRAERIEAAARAWAAVPSWATMDERDAAEAALRAALDAEVTP